ncbi:MAG TPA: hypothetical protein VHD55_00350 [Candidatus Paceibacterota bacterium]|nr:hypothetical protein [Candidatus Paceibacterota bacterium]
MSSTARRANKEVTKAYIQHEGKAVSDPRFSHMMAIALDSSSQNKRGVIRCIVSRQGNVAEKGYVDRSELHTISGDTLEHFTVGEKLQIENENVIAEQLSAEGLDYLGLEDPDIWIDQKTGLLHLYFTMPFVSKEEGHSQIHLGHAVGKDLNSLQMTMPALRADTGGKNTAKEVSIAPTNSKGLRYNLFESSQIEGGVWYSTVRVGIAADMDQPWQFGETVFHPKEKNIAWAGGHASPGPLFSKEFIDVGEGKLLGIMNGREANQQPGDKTIYGMFSVGLFVYDYENGKVDWVSPEPLIIDSEAKTITFASQFVETGKGEGILYAHVDDSFVRAYTLNAEAIKGLLLK